MVKHRGIKRYSVMLAVLLPFLCIFVYAKEAVKIEHDRTVEEIVIKQLELEHSGFGAETTKYSRVPRLTAPYSAGSLSEDSVKDALNSLKMVRYLAGVPFENVKMTDELNNISQHGAVLLAASNQFTHFPGKPSDMTEEFYNIARRGCSEANLNAGRNNVSAAIIGFVRDAGQGNITKVGHRRWALRAEAENFGIGFARGNGSYGGYRTSLHVMDGISDSDAQADSYIAWPNSGAFPLQYFYSSSNILAVSDTPWSVNLGGMYKVPSKDSIEIKLTRKSDGKIWFFNQKTPDLGAEEMTPKKLHLSVDNDGYGMGKAIVFRPDPESLGIIQDGEIFTVEIFGLKYADNSDAVIMYEVNFFDLEKAVAEYLAARKFGDVGVILPEFAITMNGVRINNKELEYPFILYNDITYFPMTYHDSRFLGIGTNYTEQNGLEIFRADTEGYAYNGIFAEKKNDTSYTATIAEGKICVNEKNIDNGAEEYPLLFFRNITYFPMTWRFCVDEFGWQYSFSLEQGLVIDTRNGQR